MDDYSNIISNNTSIILEEEENDDTIINLTRKIGKKKDKVWDYFNVVDIPNNSHKGAVCKFCRQSWKQGKPNDMKSHLALRCPNVNYSIKIEYLHMISSEDISDNEQLTQQQNINRNVIDITIVFGGSLGRNYTLFIFKAYILLMAIAIAQGEQLQGRFVFKKFL